MHSAMLRRETSIEITESMEDPCIDADDDIFNLNLSNENCFRLKFMFYRSPI